MAISSSWVDQFFALEPSLAVNLLSQLLASDQCHVEDLAVLASNLVPRGKFALAEKVFTRWAEISPSNPEPWTNLGLCLGRQKKYKEARNALEYAISLDPDYLPAMNNLGEVYQQLGEHDLQLKNCLRAVSKYPESATAFNNLGSALVDVGMFKEARHAFETSLMLDPNSFLARFNLAKEMSFSGNTSTAIQELEFLKSGGFATSHRQSEMLDFQLSIDYLTSGRIKEGWQLYEKGFSSAIPASLARGPQRQFSVPMWDGQLLAEGKRLMIWREQGIGDEIRFAALLPLLPQPIRSKVVLECDARLVNLFSRSMPDLKVRPETGTIEDFDYHLPIGSLPRLLMESVDVLRDAKPIFSPDPVDEEKFDSRLARFRDKKLIGICWRSHKLSATRNKKYTMLEDWKGVLSIPGVIYVNLQYGECENELQNIENELGIQIQRWDDLDLMNDFDGIAALIRNLDLVVSVSSAIVPLSGALGTPTMCMTHQNWALLGERDYYPWFPSINPLVVRDMKPIATALPIVESWIKNFIKNFA